MWLLNFLPDWIIHAITFAGITLILVTSLLEVFPLIKTYKQPLQIASIGVLGIGLYFEGCMITQRDWESKVKQMEAKALIAEAKAKAANAQIQIQYVDRVQTVTDVQYVVQERIREVEKLIDAECKIPPEALDILNIAADNKVSSDGVQE